MPPYLCGEIVFFFTPDVYCFRSGLCRDAQDCHDERGGDGMAAGDVVQAHFLNMAVSIDVAFGGVEAAGFIKTFVSVIGRPFGELLA